MNGLCSGEIAALLVKPAGEAPRRLPRVLVAAQGLAGDAPAKRADAAVSLADETALRAAQADPGLCAARFFANIVTTGLPLHACAVGARLAAGGAVLELTQLGKRCFAECRHVMQGSPCPLAAQAAFARVVRPGEVCEGDEIVVIG